ncbi:MAG: type IV toxin-antitoxin system AbiEi family antitoxin domain-containing protein [Lachnospiraceae bacterium]|nr:type IV toxin-antitoxin system AbiEi family antitoxin domain-containing protein [Lachnospiraceae bacterium]
MTDVWKAIQNVAEANDGVFTAKQIEEAGISRVHLKTYVDKLFLIRTGHGRYALPDSLTDEYAALQERSHVLLFSYGTALYLWEMSDRVPHHLDVTVPSGTNVSRIRKDHPDLRVHYVKKDLYEIGITEALTPMGRNVRLYDKERCICDLIRARKDMDLQLYSGAIKAYFGNQPNMRKLLKYGKQFGVEDKIRTYSEVLA